MRESPLPHHLLLNVKLIACMVLVSLSGCTAAIREPAQTIDRESLPELSSVFQAEGDSSGFVMISSSQFSPSHNLVVEGLSYTVATDNDGKVVYIGTSDPDFETDNGLRIGSTLQDVRSVTANRLLNEKGYGYTIHLPSGWTAGFFMGEHATDYEPDSESKVGWFFKRQEHE